MLPIALKEQLDGVKATLASLSEQFPDVSPSLVQKYLFKEKVTVERGHNFYSEFIATESQKLAEDGSGPIGLPAAAIAYKNLPAEEKKRLKRIFEKSLDDPIGDRFASFVETESMSRRSMTCRDMQFRNKLLALTKEMFNTNDTQAVVIVTRPQPVDKPVFYYEICNSDSSSSFLEMVKSSSGMDFKNAFDKFICLEKAAETEEPCLKKPKNERQKINREAFKDLFLSKLKSAAGSSLDDMTRVPWHDFESDRMFANLKLIGWPEDIAIEGRISAKDMRLVTELLLDGTIHFEKVVYPPSSP